MRRRDPPLTAAQPANGSCLAKAGDRLGASVDTDPLLLALDELSALATDEQRNRLDGGRTRLAAQRLRVLVAGEAKRGKSTLVNALLGQPLLRTPRPFHGGCVLSQELRMITLREHGEDLDRVIRIMIINWMRSHSPLRSAPAQGCCPR